MASGPRRLTVGDGPSTRRTLRTSGDTRAGSLAAIPAPVDAAAQRLADQVFEGLIDALPFAIWTHDRDGYVVRGNAAFKFARRDVALDGRRPHWTDLFHPDDRHRADAAFQDVVALQSFAVFEARVVTAAGGYCMAACNLSTYADAHRGARGYFGCCSDISAQHHAERALREMGSRVVAAQEEERSRIARELHDDLGQQTALLAAKIELLLRSTKASGATLRKGIEEARQNVHDLAVSIHNLSHELHPPKLKLLGLQKTLESLCRNVSKESGVEVLFEVTAIPSGVPECIALCVCRVAQEALQNAVKHSGARRIDVALSAPESRLTLRVTDGGRGFDPLASSGTGIGLISMRERVELNGGQLSVDASPSGTTIVATLPIELPY